MIYIERIVNFIIRPNREHYHIKRLGDPQITVNTQDGQIIKARRQDRIILNKNNEHLHLSFYQIQSVTQIVNNKKMHLYDSTQNSYFNFNANKQPDMTKNAELTKNADLTKNVQPRTKVQNYRNKCVIYLHANNGSRIEGLSYIDKLLAAHCNVCLFDCSGSGNSAGQYVTLGLKQSRDLDCIANFLSKQKSIQHISLWGRSMGASTAIIYASKHSPIKIDSIVLDSPFKDLQKLVRQIASDKTGLPKVFFNPLIPVVRSQIMRVTGYNIKDLKLKKYVLSQGVRQKQLAEIDTLSSQATEVPIAKDTSAAEIPALFIVSHKDKFVRCHHGEKLYKRYPCQQKQLYYIQMQHQEARSPEVIAKIISFIINFFNDNQHERNCKIQKLMFSRTVQSRSKNVTRKVKQMALNIQIDQKNNLNFPQYYKQSNTSQSTYHYPSINPYHNKNQTHQKSIDQFNQLKNNVQEFCTNQNKTIYEQKKNSIQFSPPKYVTINRQYFNQRSNYFNNTSTITQNNRTIPQNNCMNRVYNPYNVKLKPKSQHQKSLSHQNSHEKIQTLNRHEGSNSFIFTSLQTETNIPNLIYSSKTVLDKPYMSSSTQSKIGRNKKQKISLSSTLALQQQIKNSTYVHQQFFYPQKLQNSQFKNGYQYRPKTLSFGIKSYQQKKFMYPNRQNISQCSQQSQNKQQMNYSVVKKPTYEQFITRQKQQKTRLSVPKSFPRKYQSNSPQIRTVNLQNTVSWNQSKQNQSSKLQNWKDKRISSTYSSQIFQRSTVQNNAASSIVFTFQRNKKLQFQKQ